MARNHAETTNQNTVLKPETMLKQPIKSQKKSWKHAETTNQNSIKARNHAETTNQNTGTMLKQPIKSQYYETTNQNIVLKPVKKKLHHWVLSLL